jgi:hypothetical protein
VVETKAMIREYIKKRGTRGIGRWIRTPLAYRIAILGLCAAGLPGTKTDPTLLSTDVIIKE